MVQTVITTSYGPLGIDVPPTPAFSDGIYVIEQNGQIYLLASGGQTMFSALGETAEAIAFAPAASAFGTFLYAFTRSGRVVRVAPDGTTRVFATGFANSHASSGLAFSANGQSLFLAPDRESRLYRIRPATRGVSNYGHGCPGTQGLTPAIGALGNPAVGNLGFAVTVTNSLPNASAVVLLGFAADRMTIGSCDLLVRSPLLTGRVTMTNGTGDGGSRSSTLTGSGLAAAWSTWCRAISRPAS